MPGRLCKARYSSSPREVRAPDRRTEGAAVCGLAEALARPLRKVAVALRCASVRIGRQKGVHDSRRAGLLNWHDDGRRRRQREDRFARAEAARLALAALAVNLRVKEAAPEPSCEGLSLGGAKGPAGPSASSVSHTLLQHFLSHGTSSRSPRHSHRPPPWKRTYAVAAAAQATSEAEAEVARCT